MSSSGDDEIATMSRQGWSCASGNLSTKRVRPWESCDDVQELKMMLIEKEEQLSKKDAQLAELQRKLKSAKKQAASSPAGAAHPLTSSTSTPLMEQVRQLKRSIQSQVFNQMAYKPSARCGSARLVPVEVFGITELVIEALVGDELFQKASSGPKQLKLLLSNEELEEVFGDRSFVKGLRYGATLELSNGLKFLFSKLEGNLKISGTYTMRK